MADRSDIIRGGCLCGTVQYEIDQPPSQVGLCHCRMCQKSLGNLFGPAAIFNISNVRFLSEDIVWYRSSDLVRRGFCGRCGSPVAYERGDEGVMAIWIGTFDQPELWEPHFHWWTECIRGAAETLEPIIHSPIFQLYSSDYIASRGKRKTLVGCPAASQVGYFAFAFANRPKAISRQGRQ